MQKINKSFWTKQVYFFLFVLIIIGCTTKEINLQVKKSDFSKIIPLPYHTECKALFRSELYNGSTNCTLFLSDTSFILDLQHTFAGKIAKIEVNQNKIRLTDYQKDTITDFESIDLLFLKIIGSRFTFDDIKTTFLAREFKNTNLKIAYHNQIPFQSNSTYNTVEIKYLHWGKHAGYIYPKTIEIQNQVNDFYAKIIIKKIMPKKTSKI